MNKKKIIWIIAVVLVLMIILIIGKKAGWFGDNGNYKEVVITKIEPIDIVETVAATGKIQPEIEVSLSSEVSGEIIELPIKEGQQVEKGDLLVRINPDLIQAALNQSQARLQNVKALLDQAEAGLNNSKLNYERNKQLFEKGVISKAEWDQAVTDYDMSKANVKSAYYNVKSAAANVTQTKDNLSRTTI
jgi:HlyD family secretion protein